MEFPKQLIPEGEKTKDWHKKNVLAILSKSRSTSNSIYVTERKKDYENYQIVNGNFDPKQFEYLTNMYGTTAPARFVNYPILLPKLDALAGEFLSQPLAFDVEVINQDAVNRKIEKRVAIATEVLLRPIRKEIERAIGAEFPPEEIGEEIPEDIEEFMNTPIRLSVESTVTNSLEYLISKYDLKNVFKRGIYDLFITSKEFYYVHIKNGDPYPERIDPRAMIWDADADTESLCDARYAAYETYMSINEILDIYGDELTKDEVIELEKLQNMSGDYVNGNPEYTGYYKHSPEGGMRVRVVVAQWKSIMMMRHKESENKFDPENPFLKMVDDNYKPKKNEKIVEKAITDVRQATLIGKEILVKWGRKPNQIRFESNYSDTKLDFFGVIKNNFNGTTLSLVDSGKNIQLMYNVVMHHIDLAMARAGGKSVVYDVSQKPKKIPLEDVFYHAKNSGLILINSAQEGAMGSRFNQFQQVDFTLSNSVSQMINLKIMLEETLDQLTGISRQRMGFTKSSDAVGTTQQSIVQSNLITQPFFELHTKIISDVLNCMANKLRLAWGNKKGHIATFLGDTGFKTLEITEEILDEMGVFVKNSMKEVQNKNIMLSMVERAVSSGNVDIGLLIKAVNKSTASEVETILTQGIEAIREQTQQLEQQKVQVQQEANQIEAQKMSVPIEVAKINYEREIKVAEINAEAKMGMNERQAELKEDLAEHQRKTDLDNKMMDATEQSMKDPNLNASPVPFERNKVEKAAMSETKNKQKKKK